jgi:hypothetical protein
MARSTSTKTVTSFVVAVALIVVLAAFAAVAAGNAPQPTTAPPPTPVATPGASPSPQPSADPTNAPTATPDGYVVDLEIADDHDVTVVVDDETGVITGARSGRAPEGMSVRWGDIVVQNVDADTLSLTWSGWLQDEVIKVAVVETEDGLALTFTQKLPYPNTDAMGGDRILVIDVAEAVSADDVSATFVPGA